MALNTELIGKEYAPLLVGKADEIPLTLFIVNIRADGCNRQAE